MRVLWVTPGAARLHGGPGPAVIGYVNSARMAGVDADVIVPEPPPEDREWLASQLRDGTLRMFPLLGRAPLYFSPALIRWLKANARQYDAVQVCGFLNPVSTLAAHAVLDLGRPLVLHPFGALSRYTFSHRKRRVKRWYFEHFEASLLRRAAGVHFTTPAERDEALWHGIDYTARSHIIPPVWDGGNGGVPKVARDPGRRVLFLGRLHPKKGLTELLDAWPEVRARVPGVQLEIAGDGPPDFVRGLKARVLQMEGSNRDISFPGFLDGAAKASSLATADVFVLPSHQENFGIAVVEAIAAGVPVVITQDVQVEWFVRDNGLGILTGRDRDSLASGIVRALADDSLRRHVAANGAALARRAFGPEGVGARLREMYREVIMRGNLQLGT